MDKTKVVITFDVDWAPESVIKYVANRMLKNKLNSTWFATHDSEILHQLKKENLFEIGIHPNFLPGSTQGKNTKGILTNLKNLYPSSCSVRTHSLYQSTPLLEKMSCDYELRYDSSLYLPQKNGVYSHRLEFKSSKIWRFPFIWEDDFELMRDNMNLKVDAMLNENGGFKIFNFHPIHIALNSSDLDQYEVLKSNENYPDVELEAINNYKKGDVRGIEDFFDDLLASVRNQQKIACFCLKDLDPSHNL
jgi:hypothetical protein